MFGNPSLFTRVAVGKGIGFAFGLIGFIFLPAFWPEADWQIRWGILLWYTTVGAFVGIFGVVTWYPMLKMSISWWFRGLWIGGWMNFVLVFFAYEPMEQMLLSMFEAGSIWTSPFWFVVEGAIIGLIVDCAATRLGGEGKATADAVNQ